MRLFLIPVLGVSLLAACGGGSGSGGGGSGRESAGADSPACTRTSWVAGTTEYCQGRLIHRDYVYDDYGADAGLISLDPAVLNVLTRLGARGSPLATTPGLLSPTAGDKRYPAGLENTADLVSLTLYIDGGELVADFELNTMFNPDDALAAIAIDTDNDAATGGGAWSPLKIASRGWEVLKVFSQGDAESNRIIGRLPLPAGDTWRVQAAVAQKNGTVMNVAFRGVDERAEANGLSKQFLPGAGNFWEDRQAAVLASGDISVFGEVVAVADLRRGVTRVAPSPTGFHQRVYTSQYTLGEGVKLMGEPGVHGDTFMPCEQYFHYLGKYQPYGVYIPTRTDAGTPGVQLVMHGCEANHASQVNQPGMQAQFGEGLNRILVSPLGRGPHGFYTGISERDVLDVLDDVEATYDTDRERVFTGGYSMGGYGAMRLAALYPDRFAGLVSWVGFTGDVTNLPLLGSLLPDILLGVGQALPGPLLSGGSRFGASENIIEFLGNLRHVPGAYVYGAIDELVQVTTSLALIEQLERAGVPYLFSLHTLAEHLTFMVLDSWQKEADYTRDLVRVRNPARVTWRVDPAFDYPEYGIRHDRAYWASGLRPRGQGIMAVDLSAPGCGGEVPVLATSPAFGATPVPWLGAQRVATGSEPLAAEAVLEGSLTNVLRFTVDASATCLKGKSVRYRIDTDGPVELTLSDGRRLALAAAGLHEGRF